MGKYQIIVHEPKGDQAERVLHSDAEPHARGLFTKMSRRHKRVTLQVRTETGMTILGQHFRM